ncbi:sucrase ferredoxin [Pedococcus bigeumensis]
MGFDRADVSAYGTAALATFFVALEQAGPWGRDAATESHLPAAVGRSLSQACAERGGRLSLIRRPGRHADDAHAAGHTAYLAWAGDAPWLLQLSVADPGTLLDIDLDALARGDREAVLATAPGAAPAEPILLVCTNGRRDVCCAVRGRPVALESSAAHPGRVWEASHTGGHRFAPTGVLLPYGATLARLDAATSAEVLAVAGTGHVPRSVLGPLHDRGRSPLSGPHQAAESFVRDQAGITDLTALSVADAGGTGVEDGDEDGDGGSFTVRHSDGRVWHVALESRARTELPESCGKTPVRVVDRVGRLLD